MRSMASTLHRRACRTAACDSPWRRDSTPGYERLLATLQSMRRRAAVRVMPTEGGYLIEVAVLKELEDVDRPEQATVSGLAWREGSFVRRQGRIGAEPFTLGWIPQGRDISLEQRILAELRGRLTEMAPPPRGPLGH